jgi:sugar lactone lactonase YvrE
VTAARALLVAPGEDTFGGKPFNEPNDLTIDSKGRSYFSDPRYGDRADRDQLNEKNRTIHALRMRQAKHLYAC